MADEDLPPTPTDSDETPPGQDARLGPLPANALAIALVGRSIVQTLDGRHVPIALMSQPIRRAMAWLEAHRCPNPMRCPETPPPLRQLLTLRRLSDSHAERIHDAL